MRPSSRIRGLVEIGLARCRRLIRRWRADRFGGIAVTMAISIPALIMLVGVSVDYARAQQIRSKLQRAVDTATLAMARLSDDYNDPEDAARRFIEANLMHEDIDFGSLTIDASVTKTLNSKSASITAGMNAPLFFGALLNMDTIGVDVASRAEESYRHLEISMVLDISGSMASNNKIENLRAAAREFLEIMLKSDTDAEFTTISVVPFGSDVKVGLSFEPFINPSSKKDWTWEGCIDLDTKVLTGDLLTLKGHKITPNLKVGKFSSVCPEDSNRTLFRDNRLDVLVAHVSGLQATGPSTSTDMGAFWGLAALLPPWKPYLPGVVDTAPRDFDGSVTKKLIIMTDGAINSPYRVNAKGKTFSLYDTDFAIQRLRTVCDSAKEAGVEVYTIGFEVQDGWMLDLLEDCASSPRNYFDPSGTAINDVFKTIAYRLSPLRLVR